MLSHEEGLADINLCSVATDALGFTWVSSYTGLQCYDGYNFKTIHPVAGKDRFIINYPVYIFRLNDGNLWINIAEGMLLYDAQAGSFKKIISEKISGGYYFSIVPLLQTGEGVWCMQQHKGIVLYGLDGKLKQQSSFFPAAITDSILSSQFMQLDNLISADKEAFAIINPAGGVLVADTKSRSSNIIHTNKTEIHAISFLNGSLYILGNTTFIRVKDEGQGASKEIPFIQKPYTKLNGANLSAYNKSSFLCCANDRLYNLDTNGVFNFEYCDFQNNPFIANGYLQKAYKDPFNRIWLLGYGIKRIENIELPFQHFVFNGEKNNFIRSIYYDEQKNILLAGGYNGIIHAYDTTGRLLWQKDRTVAEGEFILNIEKLTNDEYLLISFLKGWYLFNYTTKQATKFSLVTAQGKILLSNISNYPNNLQRINDSVIFIATGKDILKCVFKKSVLLSAESLLHIETSDEMHYFLYSQNHVLWAGTNNGALFRIENNTTKKIQLPGPYFIRNITEDSSGKIYVGSEKGLFVYNEAGGFLKAITTADGLRNDCIYACAQAGNNIFVSTNIGLSMIAADGTIKNFSKEMGLQENEFNTNALLQTKNGKLFFGGVNGITAFYPQNLQQVKDSAVLHITEFYVNDSLLHSFASGFKNDEIKLNYLQNRLRFSIAALGLFNTSEYVYQWRIKNLDTVWETSNRPEGINYTLQPGDYTLEIKCHQALSSGNYFFKSIHIIITPPWWQTWWFRTAVFIFIVGVVYLFVHSYNRKKYLTKIRVLEMQQQLQNERERISRELHDNIGSQISFIISNIDWTIEGHEKMNKEEKRKMLGSIHDTAKNVMGNLRESIWALNKEKITLEEFADKMKAYIRNLLSMKPDIQFETEENIQSNISFSPVDALNIFRICQECITNVIRHAEASVLKLKIESKTENNFLIEISDNGKGFEQHQNQEGHFGLQNINHRAKEMGAQISIKTGHAKGTTVSIYK